MGLAGPRRRREISESIESRALPVIARSSRDEAIQRPRDAALDCFAALAMTGKGLRSRIASRSLQALGGSRDAVAEPSRDNIASQPMTCTAVGSISKMTLTSPGRL